MLKEAFLPAVLLTGSIPGAEKAIERAIDLLDPDASPASFLVGSVRAALEQRHWEDALPSNLPLELRALGLLSSANRNCFVLRVLVRFDEDECLAFLKMSRDMFQEAFQRSVVELPFAIQAIRSRTAPIPLS